MTHYTTPEFWKYYDKLPKSVQKLADGSFERMKSNLRHPSIQLKRVGLELDRIDPNLPTPRSEFRVYAVLN